jgi:formate dehydrogenase assembly factor FdhD
MCRCRRLEHAMRSECEAGDDRRLAGQLDKHDDSQPRIGFHRQLADRRVELEGEERDALPERLRAAQTVFDTTGGLHAAALFTADGRLVALREDVETALVVIYGEFYFRKELGEIQILASLCSSIIQSIHERVKLLLRAPGCPTVF